MSKAAVKQLLFLQSVGGEGVLIHPSHLGI